MGLTALFSCKEASRRMAEGALAELCLAFHLLYCRHCRRFRRQLRLLGSAARDWADGLASPRDVEAVERRLLQRLL